MTNIISESFQGGSNGGTINLGNTAFNSLVEPGLTFSNTAVVSGEGSLAAHMVISGGHAQMKSTFTARNTVFFTIFLRPTTTPSANVVFLRAAGSGSTLGEVLFTTNQSIMIRNSGSVKIAETATSYIPLGAYIRVEWMLNTVTDKQQLRVFKGANVLGSTPDYDSGLISTTPVGQIDALTTGAINAATWDAYIDTFTADDAAWRDFSSGGIPLIRAANSVAPTDSSTTTAITVPATGVGGTVAVGDLAYLIFFGSTSAASQTAPAGWNPLITQPGVNAIAANVWSKVLTATDLASTITISHTNTAAYKRQLYLQIFSAAQVGAVKASVESVSRTGHTAPSANAIDARATVITAVGDRGSPGSTAWTLPSNLTLQQQLFGSGGGSVSSVIAVDDLVGTGSVGANLVTGTVSTSSAIMITLVVESDAIVILNNTVDSGADISVEPWSTLTRTATATGSPTSWSWTQVSPSTPSITFTVSNTATVTLIAPASIQPVTYVVRATASYATGPPASSDFNLSVYPATERFVRADGVEVPLRIMQDL
jgi:hypothetical protein